MLLPVKIGYLRKLDPQKENDKNKYGKWIRYNNDNEVVRIPSEVFTKEEIAKLEKYSIKDIEDKVKGSHVLLNRLKLLHSLGGDVKGVKIVKLEQLEHVLRQVVCNLPHNWLFEMEGDFALPYFVGTVKFHKAVIGRDSRRPAYVSMELHYIEKGKNHERNINFKRNDLDGTASEILNAKGFYLETEQAFKNYEEEIKNYKEYSLQMGKQFYAIGVGQLQNDRWSSGTVSMVKDGIPTKVVMDDDGEDDEGNSGHREYSGNEIVSPWGTKYLDMDDDDNEDVKEEEEKTVVPPTHPFVLVFDLTKHSYVNIHISNLLPYEYDKTMEAKLVLPQDRKDLIDILIQGTSLVIDDIIKGKTGGIIVMATGEPGTGKTLTAEVYSEAVEKPLYVVQCSQLGTNEEDLEKQLTLVLSRASRWGAILLIDEADVYVHTRGDDIQQNAIVGVFLRVLEYYRGILFLTSNRATIIDDAILSRLTAHIKYSVPTPDDQAKIWGILATQFKIDLSKQDVGQLVKEFPAISGRTIKNLLKLSKLLAERKKIPLGVEVIKYASTFIDYARKDEVK